MNPITIPDAKVQAVRLKLEAEQRTKDPAEIVRYSRLQNTFWRWTKNPQGQWQKQQCSRNGERHGKCFGCKSRYAKFYRDRFGSTRFRMTNSTAEFNAWRTAAQLGPPLPPFGRFIPLWVNLDPKDWTRSAPADYKPLQGSFTPWQAANPPLDVPSFIARKECAVFTVVHSETGRWSAKQPEIIMTPLKLLVLFWTAAHPDIRYLSPAGVSGQNAAITAAGQLNVEGLITFSSNGYRLTDKGRIFVEHLTKQPLPVQTKPEWVMPTNGVV